MRTFGVDVSHWEGMIDWAVASRFINFAYFKCTDGVAWVDPTFEYNARSCADLGVAHAPYHYYQPSMDPVAQAEHFYRTAGSGRRRYILDLEEPWYEDPPHLVTDVQAFLLRFAQLAGQKPAIYTSPGFWNEFIRPKPEWTKNYELLVAHYTADHYPTLPIGWDKWCIWQFTDFWFIPGCPAEVDGDLFNGDIQPCHDWFGNYRAVEPPFYSLRARSNFDNLHVRQAPDVTARELGHLSKGDLVTIEELGGDSVWVRHAAGWSCVEKDGYRYMEVIK